MQSSKRLNHRRTDLAANLTMTANRIPDGKTESPRRRSPCRPLRPRRRSPGQRRPLIWTVYVACLLVLAGIPDPAAGELDERLSVSADARTRWLQVDVDGQAPSGLFGESLEQGTSLLHRLFVEVEARATDRIRAGGLLRLSNEPERILRLGPDYFSRPEGSVFIAAEWPSLRARAGYYQACFTPLTLMRWDLDDIGLGGTHGGCAVCSGASAGTLIESLEELGKELTFEGGRLDGTVGIGLDWSLLYARPREAALDEIPVLGVFDEETFQYHQDLYAARAVLSRLHAPSLTFDRLGASLLVVRDQAENPGCPTAPEAPLCRAIEQEAFGLDYRLPVGRRLVLEGEWLRTAHQADARGDSADTRWSNGFRITGVLTLKPKQLVVKSAYLRLEAPVGSPYGALTYIGNRTGHRHRLLAVLEPVTAEAFVRWAEPVSDEWLATDRARIEAEWQVSGQLSIALPHDLRLLAGYQHERTDLDVEPEWVGIYRRFRREIGLVELSYGSKEVKLSLSQQWIWEEEARRDFGNGNAAIASFSAKAVF
jgi:hypothetical protein